MGGDGERTVLTLKAKIYPDSEQERAIAACIEGYRRAYNYMVLYCSFSLRDFGRLPSFAELCRFSTLIWKRLPSIRGMYNNSMHDAARRALTAYRACIGRGRGRPRFKSVRAARSYGYPKPQDFRLERKGGRIRLRLGKVGRVRGSRQEPLPGDPRTCTVVRKDMGTHYDYYACVTFDMGAGYGRGEEWPERDVSSPVGIDLGVSHVAAFSDGAVYDNPKGFSRDLKRFERLHRRLSETLPGTRAYDKARSRLAHAYERLTNKRKQMVEQVSHDAVFLHGGIVMEDLSVQQLRSISMSRRMSRLYADASLGMIRARIADKAQSAGRSVVLVDPRGTSQLCSRCGLYVGKGLSVRRHECPRCGLRIDRDVNAAMNILERGSARDPGPVRGPNRPAGRHGPADPAQKAAGRLPDLYHKIQELELKITRGNTRRRSSSARPMTTI